jgi:hypothetical protein
LIARAKEDGLVDGLIPHLLDGRVSILQYVDDTIIFMEHNLEKSLDIKLILCFLTNYPDLRLIFIRVRSFALVIYNTYKVDPHYGHLMFASWFYNKPRHLKLLEP